MKIRNVENDLDYPTEGREYNFRVISGVQLPPEQILHWVLLSPENTRLLLRADYYYGYGIVEGSFIRCRVDKINCSGRIYLEPLHPLYSEGSVAEFEYAGMQACADGEDLRHCIRDRMGKLHPLEIDWPKPPPCGKLVNCRVVRIKKGSLMVIPEELDFIPPYLEPGTLQHFVLSGKVRPGGGAEHFLLRGGDGIHFIKSKYYNAYGLQVGDQVRCRVLGRPSLFRHYLEPLHPHFTPGLNYEFTIVGRHPSDWEGRNTIRWEVKGPDGERHFADSGMDKDYAPGTKVSCRVEDIRMSRLRLRILY